MELELYLSRLVLDPRHRGVRRDLADCHALHRTVMSGFPDVVAGADARAALGVLFRVETDPRTGEPTLLVQSRVRPDWTGLRSGYLRPDGVGEVEGKPIGDRYAALAPGMELRFRLRANPTRRLSTPPGSDGVRPAGKRVDLRREEDQLAWLERKARDGGFELVAVRASPGVADVRLQPESRLSGKAPRGEPVAGEARAGRLTFGAVLFEGRLRVIDAAVLRRTLAEGIGSGKAYGFGLLSVAPVGR